MDNIEKNNFSDLPLIDSHFHLLFSLPLADTIRSYSEIMEYFHLKSISLLALTRDEVDSFDPTNNLKALYCKSILNTPENPDRIYVYGNIHHFYDGRDTSEGYLRQAQQLYAMGVDGYKNLDGKPAMRKCLARRLDDPIFDKMYAYIEKVGFPITMHLGDPYEFWDITKIHPNYIKRGWYCDETYPTLEQMRSEVEGILTKFPKLKLCLAHFYFLGHDLEAATEFMEKWKNVWFDLTPGGSMFVGFTERPDEWKEFFRKYSDRFMFGSDSYNKLENDYEESDYAGHRINLVRFMMEKKERFIDKDYGTLLPMNLDEDIIRKIYYENFIKRHGKAREVNTELTAENAHNILTALEHGFIEISPQKNSEVEIENLREIYNYYSKFQSL